MNTILIVILWNFGVIWDDNKKVLKDLVIYCKTQGGQNDQNGWKKETKYSNITENTELIRLRMKDNQCFGAIVLFKKCCSRYS